VTVCTNDVAFGDLVEHGLPAVVSEALGDAEVLLPGVIELEHQRIRLSAIGTRPLAEEGDQVRCPFCCDRALAAKRIGDVTLAVGGIVLALIVGPALAAVVVALASRSSAPGEVGLRLALFAAAASSGGLGVRQHERMFSWRSDIRSGAGGRERGCALGP